MLVTPSLSHCSNKYELAREGEKFFFFFFFFKNKFRMKSSSAERDEFSYIYIHNKYTVYTHILCKQKLILDVINLN